MKISPANSSVSSKPDIESSKTNKTAVENTPPLFTNSGFNNLFQQSPKQAVANNSAASEQSITNTAANSFTDSAESIGPEVAAPVDPANSIAPPDMDPPYNIDDFIHLESGNSYRVTKVHYNKFMFGGSNVVEIERVIFNDDGSSVPWEGSYEVPTDSDPYEAGDIIKHTTTGILGFDKETGALKGAAITSKDSNAISGSNTILTNVHINEEGEVDNTSEFFPEAFRELNEQQNYLDDLQQFLDKFPEVIEDEDKGEIETHPDDIDIGPGDRGDSGTSGSGSAGSGGGGGGSFGGLGGGGAGTTGPGGWGGTGVTGVEEFIEEYGPLGGDVEDIYPGQA